MKLIPLIADNWRMDGGVAFGVVPKSIWARKHKPDENNTIAITTRCLLIVDSHRKILIDTGLGNKRSEKYYEVRYRESGVDILNSLKLAGYNPEDITDIIFTHLHDDHVGAATRLTDNGTVECVFANAEYWVSATHWNWALFPNKRESAAYFADNFQPLSDSGRLHLLKEGDQPFNSITLNIYNGHTRGQIIPFIHINGKTFVYTADFIPTMANIPIPFVPSVDIEPLISLEEKEKFLKEAVSNKYILIFEHDAEIECCTVTDSEKGIVSDKTFTLSEIEL